MLESQTVQSYQLLGCEMKQEWSEWKAPRGIPKMHQKVNLIRKVPQPPNRAFKKKSLAVLMQKSKKLALDTGDLSFCHRLPASAWSQAGGRLGS